MSRPSIVRPHIGDLLAGISVALVLIPQSMAYAELAGLPPYLGLFASALPPLAAAAFTSSPYLQTGPVALTSLLTFGVLSDIAEEGTEEYIRLAALLAFIVGVTRFALGVFRLGVVAYLMSEPVLTGFTSAAAVLIVGSQLPTVFGVTPPDGGVLGEALWAVTHPSEWQAEAMLFAAATIVIVVGGRRIHRLFPGVLIAVIGAVIISNAVGYTGDVIAEIPNGLPDFGFDLPWDSVGELLVPGIIIALVAFAEPASIARTFATEERMPWSPNKELIGQGIANAASSFSGSFPVGGSFSRSSLNRFAGARTAWSGAVTGAVVLLFLPVGSILEGLPRAVLGAIVIAVVANLFRPQELVRLVRRSPPQALVGISTFVATLALSPNIEFGVLIGVGLAIAVHLWRELAVHLDSEYRDGTLTLHPQGIFWFGSVPSLEQDLIELLAQHPLAERIVLDLSGVGRLDYTGLTALQRLLADARLAGLGVEINGIPPHVPASTARELEAAASGEPAGEEA